MGYNSENVKRIKALYEDKFRVASMEADARKRELWEKIPEVRELDTAIADIGLKAVYSSIGGGEGAVAIVKALKEQSLELQAEREKLLTSKGYPADYSAVHYECEKCLDSGYTDEGMCECMKRALILAGYESSGLGKLMQTQTFEAFSLDYYRSKPENYEKMKHNFDTLKNFAENFSSSSPVNLALFGGTGLGKTHLSTAAAKTVIDKGYDVLYVTAVGMLSDFEKERFGVGYSDTDVGSLARYYDCDLLIVDDIGTEVSNQFTVSVIYNVINTRLAKKKSTVISTNLTPAELRQRYWDRIASRIFGEYTPLLFEGVDVRMQKLKAKSSK
ncbi:MAG: DNA replication protein DnaC [Ruminococcaceae bacterium]|nr:DNA replication protein DnaC [Oscillospiraceae bacterium]